MTLCMMLNWVTEEPETMKEGSNKHVNSCLRYWWLKYEWMVKNQPEKTPSMSRNMLRIVVISIYIHRTAIVGDGGGRRWSCLRPLRLVTSRMPRRFRCSKCGIIIHRYEQQAERSGWISVKSRSTKKDTLMTKGPYVWRCIQRDNAREG